MVSFVDFNVPCHQTLLLSYASYNEEWHFNMHEPFKSIDIVKVYSHKEYKSPLIFVIFG
jgi:hypothetical protein